MILSNVELFAALDEGQSIRVSKGTLTLEMINLGPASFMLKRGMAIAQLIVEEVKGCPIENPSQFQGQQNPAG